jgi:hypothetical protein
MVFLIWKVLSNQEGGNMEASAIPLAGRSVSEPVTKHRFGLKLLFACRAALYGIDKLGWAASLVLLTSAPALVLLLTSNPIVLLMAAEHTPYWLFMLICLPRMLLSHPVNYLLGKRLAELATGEADSRLLRFISRPFVRLSSSFGCLRDRLNASTCGSLLGRILSIPGKFARKLMTSQTGMLGMIALFTVVPLPTGVSIYNAAGVVRTNPRYVACLDLVMAPLMLTAIYCFGFNPLHMCQGAFNYACRPFP